MQDVRCKGCGKLLAKVTVMVAAIKCPSCHMLFEYHVYVNTLHVTNSYDIKRPESTETTPHNGATTSVE